MSRAVVDPHCEGGFHGRCDRAITASSSGDRPTTSGDRDWGTILQRGILPRGEHRSGVINGPLGTAAYGATECPKKEEKERR